MKILSWNCRGLGNLAIVSELRQLLVANIPDIIFLSETNLRTCEFDRIRRWCNMTGCFVMDAVGRKGGLAMLWTNDWDINIQSFSSNHIHSH